MEFAMIYRKAIYALAALMMVNGAVADARPDADQAQNVDHDLTGYWRQADGNIFHFTQDGTSLTSRYWTKSQNIDENDIDFTATIHGNLQIWVGMGLTLSDDGLELRGFRGDRIVDPKTCSVTDSAPVAVVYTRVADSDLLR
jgi:hypothetical protein